MVAVAARLGEDLCQAREVLCTEIGLGHLLVDGPQPVNILDGSESLLPHLQLARHVELLKTRFETLVEGLGV